MDLEKSIIQASGLVRNLADLKNMPTPEARILFAKIKLLWKCNLSCIFCTPRPASLKMPASKVNEILVSLKNQGLIKVHFSGGEVFLHPEIFQILNDACQLGLQVNLTTNATLLNKEKIKLIKKTKVHSVSISLDGATPKLHDKLRGHKGAFEATVNAIRLLSDNPKKRPGIRVNTVVSRENCHDLDNLYKLLSSISKKIKWTLLLVHTNDKKLMLTRQMANDLISNAKNWDILDTPLLTRDIFQLSEKHISKSEYGTIYDDNFKCYIPWLHVFIDPAGFVYPCCMTRGQIPAIGNVNNDSMEEILSCQSMKDIQMNMAQGRMLAPCLYCDDFINENDIVNTLIKNDN